MFAPNIENLDAFVKLIQKIRRKYKLTFTEATLVLIAYYQQENFL